MTYHPVSNLFGVAAFLCFLVLAGIAFVYAIHMRISQVTVGKRWDVRWDEIPQRVKNVFIYVLGQKRLPRNGYLYSGVLHMFIFGAFMVLSVDTINFILDGVLKIGSVAQRSTPGAAFHLPGSGTYYQGLADSFRFLCMIGLGMAFVNRTVIKPDRLPLTRDAMYTIFFIFGLMLFVALSLRWLGPLAGPMGLGLAVLLQVIAAFAVFRQWRRAIALPLAVSARLSWDWARARSALSASEVPVVSFFVFFLRGAGAASAMASKWTETSPQTMWSPSFRPCSLLTASPLRRVPLALPRSSSTNRPPLQRMVQCFLETEG